MAPDLGGLALEGDTLAEIEPQAGLANQSDEALMVVGGGVATLYEINGVALNPSPVAHLFGADLAAAGTVPFPNIEYRITDATEPDGEGRFWVIKYFFPGDVDLRPEVDPRPSATVGGRATPATRRWSGWCCSSTTVQGSAWWTSRPIQLELLPDEARNWEGLVRLEGRGFLLMTDKFPETILAFVALPEGD